MFQRKVQFNGVVYSYHEVVSIKSTKNNTSITVCSYRTSPYLGWSENVNRVISVSTVDGITFEQAENLAMESSDFAEYIDSAEELLEQLAPTLTDEQAATIQSLYPEWDSNSSYTQNDRVRYSNGFYKCLQTHTAQESWNPVDAASLWTAIVDATILPIGEYPLWHQPSSTNPYMTNDIVTYQDSLWICLIDNNVWAPGVYGWDIYFEPEPEPEPVIELQEWIQPDSTNAYAQGAQVIHNSSIWESEIDNNVWEPGIYGWILISEKEVGQTGQIGETGQTGETGETNPIEGETGETGESSQTDELIIPEWQQPDSSNPYMRGDTVMHQGSTWISLIDNNVWEPGAVGTESLWQIV